ncbi:FAD-binding protein, partial [Eggerthella lenta]
MEDLSRRTFLRGALLAGAGAVGAGALTACAPQTTESKSAGASAAADDATVNGDYPWPVNPPEIAAEDVEEEVSADIIIVGLGIAGVAAARSAVEEGASIIAFEKSEKPNVRSGDFAIMGGETMKRWGRENIVDIDEACDHEVEEGSYFPKRSIYTKWAKHSGEAFDWYL